MSIKEAQREKNTYMTGNKNSECITVSETMCVQPVRPNKTIRENSVHDFQHLRIILSNNNRS